MTLHLAALSNSSIHSNNLILDFLGVSVQMIVLPANKKSFISFLPIIILLIYFPGHCFS